AFVSNFYYLFSFYPSCDHRALHSFPTRRSSDLAGRADRVAERDSRTIHIHPLEIGWREFPFARHRQRLRGKGFVQFDEIHVLQRSEEHTSELQSRENLVCRLRLEKKKYR